MNKATQAADCMGTSLFSRVLKPIGDNPCCIVTYNTDHYCRTWKLVNSKEVCPGGIMTCPMISVSIPRTRRRQPSPIRSTIRFVRAFERRPIHRSAREPNDGDRSLHSQTQARSDLNSR